MKSAFPARVLLPVAVVLGVMVLPGPSPAGNGNSGNRQDVSFAERAALYGTSLTLAALWLAKNNWSVPLLIKASQYARTKTPGYKQKIILDQILAQLHPNGGSSLRDSLNRIERNQAVMVSEAKLASRWQRLMVDEIGLATFIADAEGKFTSVSQGYLNMTGLTIGEVIADGWRNSFAEKERETVGAAWGDAVKEERDFHISTVYFNHSTRQTLPVYIDAYVVHTDDGVVSGWVGRVSSVVKPT